jgi:S1-C subfamily serine protease
VGEDPATDLAIIRIEVPDEKLAQLTVAPLGDSEALEVGDAVLAIGSPYGLEGSASFGIVSSLGRSRPGLAHRLITDMIQTDAAINPGNSGGPLLDAYGRVVGINEQIEAPTPGSAGVGFAIPVNTLKRLLPDLKAGRQPQHAWLGMGGIALAPTLAEQLDPVSEHGVIVIDVVPGSPAAQAGLRGAGSWNPRFGDIITSIDGHPMRDFADIAAQINVHAPGDTIEIAYERDGETKTIKVALGVWKQTAQMLR